MTRIGWVLTALIAALVAALIAWFMRSIEWVEVDVPTPARGEAARDRFYVAKQLARRLGATVATVRDLERLPPVGATLVIGSRRWSMFPGREAALRRWIDAGGHLVVLQSAWSAEGDTPRWVPMRSTPLRRDGPAGAASAAAAASAPRDIAAFLALLAKGGPCDDFVEPEGIDPAFGAARHYRLCGEQIRVLYAAAPTWLLRSSEGAVAARVGYGRGDITANALDGSFDNRALVRDDGALAFAAMLQLRDGDTVWFFDEETRARLLSLLWDHGAAAFLLAGAAILLLLWRSGARFGPLLADAARSRRSVGEQVRRTAAFIAAGGGAALHRASVRALEEEARRSIAGYATLLGARERAEAIARATREDAPSLGAAMSPLHRPDRHRRHGHRAARACPSRPPSGSPPIAAPPLFFRPEPLMSTTPNTTPFSHAAEILQRLRDEIAKAMVGQRDVVEQLLVAIVALGPRPHRRRPRPGQDAAGARPGAIDRAALRAHPVHARPDAVGHHRPRHLRGRPGGQPHMPACASGAGRSSPTPAGRRDQPRAGEDAGRAA